MNKEKLNIVLAGQANVGKSVIFNYLTGLHQHTGNWPGKTVEKAEGTLCYGGYIIDVLDLPGIYSFSAYSLEELISREYIAVQKPDFILNIVDATHLERNLIFTLQLLELEKPTVLVLNMSNLLQKRGIEINFKELEKILGIPVIPVAAICGKGLTKTLDAGIDLIDKNTKIKSLKYGKEVEDRIEQIIQMIKDISFPYSKRWTAIKLLERDIEVEKMIKKNDFELIEEIEKLRLELEKIHGHNSSIIISDERCHLVSEITKRSMKIVKHQKESFDERLDGLTTHKILGYPIMIFIIGFVFLAIFRFGDWSSSLLGEMFLRWQDSFQNIFGISGLALLAWSVPESIFSLIEVALPYILPFYILLFILEDCGYLARVAYLSDNLMHKIGIHGKACIPLVLGFGCNVPACLSCRIMETQREKFITGFLTTFVPCSAVTIIIMGLVGKFVGVGWAFGLYFFVVLIILGLGKLSSVILPGEPTELIMEMPDYKFPNFRTIILQTWFRLKEFIFIAGPLVIISGIIIKAIDLAGLFPYVANFLSPISVTWLGLPAVTGILLIFGILRKELILVMLAMLLGTTNFALVLSPVQMVVLGLVSMLYIPCVATIAAFWREFGWKRALGVAGFKIMFAIIIGGLASRFLNLFEIL